MQARRDFLRQVVPAGAAGLVGLKTNWLERVVSATSAVADRSAADLAADESYWREIQQAFTLDRTIINLNNGYTCPSPRVVHEALKRYLDMSNQAPIHYMWNLLEPNVETVRRNLAAEAGCDAEELAITRNASEGLQIAQLGIDLHPGDEVLTTNQDYGRMLDTWEQRVRRDKIKLTKISFPVPTTNVAELKDRVERAITPKTKVIHFCHITNLTGQLFPVRDIARMARSRGIQTIVDGAHAFAHFPFKLRDLEVDYYGTSLHKWLLAPVGTGFLYVRRENIEKLWALTPPPASKMKDIRKFEEVGTHPAANHNAIAEALAFHQAIGIERKSARLRYLTDRFATRLEKHPRVKILSSRLPDQAWGLANVSLEGVDVSKAYDFLWTKYRIITAAIKHAEYQGLRVTPNVYTTLEELDTFSTAIEDLLKNGATTSQA
ncbi:MAG: aminotransferase V [Acidobacteria bacterium 13_1_40CM_65_14]|jgi:selenocysteine lyase/cysteine desulfurase|nr:MAG: aminotransferase V [Acidobacteria bacterium 13_1_40CM_65_14]OLC80449.1 MAG: aminotransferase V [Acidobacteria bacterium 13_1_40CM_4_65_8]OLD22183.1 MAG: aminotransferase V [Acidobacteria bacterium 13_1_40CM_3_65_5]